ncbi:MAG: hypothetical protein K9G26_03235 [Emcibacter sp.]|nr:hypothetical protein [Emcibacter sp.]
MLGNNFLSGASSRLLPPSIPFRFFTAAVIFYGLFWIFVFFNADQIRGYIMGSGPVLSMIHLATLGVLTMSAIGASLQLLSVATRRPFKGFWLCRLVSWIYILGFMLLAYSMFFSLYLGMLFGAVLTGAGLLIYFYLIIDNIWGVKGMGAIMIHCWAAMLSLGGIIALGILLIIDMDKGFMDDHLSIALSHFILATYGFMSLLAMGFSYILIPMFSLSPAPPEYRGRLSVLSNIFGLLLVLWGVNSAQTWLSLLGVLSACFGSGIYVHSMMLVYKSRMRKRLGMPFLLIRISWVMLISSILWGGLGLMGYWPEYGPIILGLLAIVGWLLTFLMGVLQRIIPFLSSMHTSDTGGVPMLVSSMADDRLLKVSGTCHLIGFFTASVAIAFDLEDLMRAGAVIGFVSAISLLYFLVSVMAHMVKAKSN